MFTTKKVLIVDDEESSRLYLASILEELHPELYVRLAATPAEALYILQKDRIDLVLLDVEMPGMSGLEMLTKLREINKNISVIFVSAYKRAEFIQQAMRLDAVDYIDKPVNPTELENALIKAFQTNQNTSQSRKKQESLNRFCLLTDSGEMFVKFDEIQYFETMGRYAQACFADGSTKIVRDNLERLSKKLPEEQFVRVSRQYIVNEKTIKQVSRDNKTLTLQSGSVLFRIYPMMIKKLIVKYKLMAHK